MGITDGVFRFAVDHVQDRKRIFSAGLYTILVGALLLLALLPLVGLIPGLSAYLWLVGLYTIASCLHTLCAQFVRAEGKTALFAVQGMINTALVIGLNILFLAVLHYGVTGYVLSIVLADTLCALLLVVREKLWRQLTLKPGGIWKQMLIYSVPMIPTTIFWWITNVSDRYMVSAIISTSANGIYAVSYKLPTIMTLISGIFMEAWQFSAISEAGGDRLEHTKFFSRVWCAFQAMLFVAAAFITGFAQLGVKILAAPGYYQAWLYVPVLGIAMVFASFDSYLGTVYMVEKRSGRTFVTAMIGAVLNIILNLILIPSPLGAQGAAIATAASYLIVFLIRAIDARRFIPFKLYTFGVVENCVILTVQTVFMVLQLPGWLAVQAACIVLMLAINRKPLFATLGRIKNIRKRYFPLDLWNSLFGKLLQTFLISMVPVIELRGAIPYGVARGLEFWQAIPVAIVGNLVPVPFIIIFIKKIFAWLRTISAGLDRLVTRLENRALSKTDTVKKYAFWGLFLFVAIPLPGTGAWTGALIAAMLEMRVKDAFPAIALGVLTAGAIITFLTYVVGLTIFGI